MAGEVRGIFDLSDRPATAAMRRLRREAEQLDLVLSKLGETVDSVFSSKNVAEIKLYEEALHRLEAQARTTFGSLSRNAREAEFNTVGSIRRMDVSVALLRENLGSLSREKATPKINLGGVAEADAQITLIEKRLNSLGRSTSTPRIGIPASSLAANQIATSTTGGGGGGGFLGRFTSPLMLAAGAGALGAIPPLTGSAVGLGGSLGAAALGAGSIGLGAAGVGAAAIGEIAPVALSSVAGIKLASKALKKYREEVIKSGVNSEASRQKLRLYNIDLQNAPAGTSRFLRAREGLKEEFRADTKPAQRGFTGIGTRGLNLGRQLTPQFSRLSNEFFNEAQPQAGHFADFLASPESRQFFEAMGRESKAALGPTEHIAESITGTLMNLTRAARPFFHEGLKFLEKWTGGWHTSSKDIKSVRQDMAGWVNQLKSWGKLTGATFELLKDLGSAGAGSGKSLVDDLTEQLNQWDEWINRNPRKVHNFFSESVESTEKLASALSKITAFLWKIGRMLTPLLNELSQFITFASNSGLLSSSTLPLLLAGGYGIKNLMGSARGRILGGGAAAGGVGAGEGLLLGSTLGGSRGAALGGTFLQRAGARMSTVGAGGLGADALAAGGTFLRGFGSRLLPVAAALGALQYASFPGSGTEKDEAALSAATVGLYPMPKTKPEREDQERQRAEQVSAYQSRRFSGSSPSAIRQHIAALRGHEHRIFHPPGTPVGELSQADYAHQRELGLRVPGEEEAALLHKERKALEQRQLPAALRLRGAARAADFSHGFEINVKEGMDPAAALRHATVPLLADIKHLGPAGGKVLAQNFIHWAQIAKRENPKLTKPFDELVEGIEGKFSGLGRHVEIVNGRIVQGTRAELSHWADLIQEKFSEGVSAGTKLIKDLEHEALRTLRLMGYSPKEAQMLKHEATTGIPSKAQSAAGAVAHHMGRSPTTISTGPQGGHARGGRLPVPANGSERDEVYMGGGQWGAGNELVVPSHTERAVNQILGRAGKTLGGMVAMNNRAHWQMPTHYEYAVGGRRKGRRSPPMGGAGYVFPFLHSQGLSWSRTDQGVDFTGSGPISAIGAGNVLSTGAPGWPEGGGVLYQLSGGPDRGKNVFVYEGVDATVHAGQHLRPGQTIATFRPGGSIEMGWADAGGTPLSHGEYVEGKETVFGKQFRSFLHSIQHGGAVAGPAGAGGAPAIHLRGRRSGLGGVPGALADRGSEMMAAGMSRNLNKLIGQGGGGRGRTASTAGGLDAWLTRALRITGHYSAANLRALRGRAMQESGGDPTAINNTDSNAAAGHPSQGLLQTIPETFATYREPGLSGGILNPVANAAAAINYMYCVPLDTEILTREGWKSHDAVEEGDETLGYNPDTGRMEWTAVTGVLRDREEEIVEIGRKDWSVRVTPAHRWWSDSLKRKQVNGERGYNYEGEFVETQNLGELHRIRLAALAETEAEVEITPQEAAVLGWLVGDGTTNTWDGDATQVAACIYQAKPQGVEELERLLADIPHGHSVRRQDGVPLPQGGVATATHPLHTFRLRAEWLRDVLRRARIAELGHEGFVMALSDEARACWFDALIRAEGHRAEAGAVTGGDGYERSERVSIAQNEGEVLRAIILAAYLEGYRPSVTAPRGEVAPLRVVHLARPHITPQRFEAPRSLGVQPIWCVATGLGTWTARQSGQVFLTGNSRYGHIVGPSSSGYATGGRRRSGFSGWFKDGFRGRVSGPTLMGVGEAGPEEVQITPTPKRSRAGRSGGGHPIHVEVKMEGGVHIHGAQDTKKVGEEIGRHAARELTKAMRESDDVRDVELIGG